MSKCSSKNCSKRSVKEYECDRCGRGFCVNHKDHLYFFEPDLGLEGYAVSSDASRKEIEEAKKRYQKLVEEQLQKWGREARERGLSPYDWGEIKTFEGKGGWAKSGAGWYFCEVCYSEVAGEEPNSSRTRETDVSDDPCFVPIFDTPLTGAERRKV